MNGFLPMSLDEARRYIQQHIEPLELEKVALEESLHRYMGETVFATYDEPPFSKSAVDGFACHEVVKEGFEGGISYTLVGTIGAGSSWASPLRQGEALRLMTGAPIPKETYGVVMQELCRVDGEEVYMTTPVEAGRHIILQGIDGMVGQELLRAGQRITEGTIALLASQGIERVAVHRRPKVLLMTSGKEVQELDQELEPAQIYNSNRYMLKAALQQCGITTIRELHISDDVHCLSEQIQLLEGWLSQVDCVISSGGVSVGAFDTLPYIYAELGYETVFNRLAMRPGGACYGGYKKVNVTNGERHEWAFGLSGNPQAAYNQFQLLVKTVLERMMGGSGELTRWEAVLGADVEKRLGVERYVHGRLAYDGGLVKFIPFEKEKSHGVKYLAQVEAIGRLGAHHGGEKDTLVEVVPVK